MADDTHQTVEKVWRYRLDLNTTASLMEDGQAELVREFQLSAVADKQRNALLQYRLLWCDWRPKTHPTPRAESGRSSQTVLG